MINSARIGCWTVLLALVACGGEAAREESDDPPENEAALVSVGPEVADAVSAVPWESLGLGVSAKTIGSGKEIMIVYGGYSAADVYVQRWANELYRAKGDSLGIGPLVAVRGPNQPGYANREIANSKLAAWLGAGRAADATSIIVIAHSSGTYVAAELFGQLKAGRGGVPADTLHKVKLMNLDGGGLATSALGPTGISRAYFVYACDRDLGRCSHNAGSMQSLGRSYASLGGSIRVNADGSGCSGSSSGGLWCLHDTLITTRPHNPNMYDLGHDYTDFAGATRNVVTSYLDALDGT